MFPTEAFHMTLVEVDQIFTELEISFHITGGLAFTIYAEPRFLVPVTRKKFILSSMFFIDFSALCLRCPFDFFPTKFHEEPRCFDLIQQPQPTNGHRHVVRKKFEPHMLLSFEIILLVFRSAVETPYHAQKDRIQGLTIPERTSE